MPDGGPSAWAPPPVTITGERALLTRHLDWVANQPWCDEAYTDLRTLLGQLRSANGTAPEKPVGRCYMFEDGTQCGGPIWIDTVAGHAHCSRCRKTWDGPEIARLKWELDEMKRPRTEDGHRMLTAEEIAAKKGWKRGTVFVRAHRAGIPSVRGYYDERDFQERMSA